MTLVSLTGPRLACMIFEVRKMKKKFILFSFFDSWKAAIFLILLIMAGYCRNPSNQTSSNTCEIFFLKGGLREDDRSKGFSTSCFHRNNQ